MKLFLFILFLMACEIAGQRLDTDKCRDKFTYITTVPNTGIPQNETEYIVRSKEFGCDKCPNKNLTYVTDLSTNKTIVLCSKDQFIFGGSCPEWNIGTFQANFYASCANLCPDPYSIWDSYKFMVCFPVTNETDSGKEQRNNSDCSCEKAHQENTTGTYEHNYTTLSAPVSNLTNNVCTTQKFWKPLCIATLVFITGIIAVIVFRYIHVNWRKGDSPSMKAIKVSESENQPLNEGTLDGEEEGAGSGQSRNLLDILHHVSTRGNIITQESFDAEVEL